jgi:hypothetical protein
VTDESPQAPRPRSKRWPPFYLWATILLLALTLTVIVVAGRRLWREAAGPFLVPPLSSSPFLNTGAEASFVGSEACRSCHATRDVSFRRTGMGRSMAEVNPEREPADGAFEHPPSRRQYQVRRRDGRLWHRELLLVPGAEVVLSEFPVKYVVGSGQHARTYLVEADGFLVESPVTWYASRQAWDMSPGYEGPDQQGFARSMGEACLMCHAGQAEAVERSLHRMRVHEAAIGCERCHGPGSVHVERRNGGARPLDRIDHTIVNPSHLPRPLAEAICQQCHLQTGAMVFGRGRKAADFRPGLPLQDFRQDYTLETPDSAMTVVGHVEQMHLSRCYQRSETFSCLTCHNPHNEPPSSQRVSYYKAICLDCHRPEQCTVPAARLHKESPANNCLQCHMPQSPTDIPHVAFTHHRVGIHDRPAAAKGNPAGSGVLRPVLDLSRLPEIDQKRSLGLGYLEIAKGAGDPASYQERGLKLLREVRRKGLRDPVVDAALARLGFENGDQDAVGLAASALSFPQLPAHDRCNALLVIAGSRLQQGKHQEVVKVLSELTRLRRFPVDWLLRADCEKALGNDDGMVEALEMATRINPRLWKIHGHLAEYYRQHGDDKRAGWHQQRAMP